MGVSRGKWSVEAKAQPVSWAFTFGRGMEDVVRVRRLGGVLRWRRAGAVARLRDAPISESRYGAPGTLLVVGDDLAGLGDVLFDGFDLVGPVASGFVGVGNAGGVLALGLG